MHCSTFAYVCDLANKNKKFEMFCECFQNYKTANFTFLFLY